MNDDFKYSAGDLDAIDIQTLSFEEFLMALGKEKLYQQLDLYGNSSEKYVPGAGRAFTIYTARLADIRQLC